MLSLFIVGLVVWLLPTSSKGEEGEYIVNSGLEELLDQEEYHLIANLTLPTYDGTTQIDHVIISRFGLFVIETKNMSGWIFGHANQATWTQVIYQFKQTFQNPLRQNYKHVKALQEYFGLGSHQIYNVVVFVGESTFKTQMPPHVIHGVSSLVELILSKRVLKFSEETVIHLVEGVLQARLPEGAETTLDHIEHVNQKLLSDFDEDQITCPRCDGDLVERLNKKTSEPFLGCKRFPRCKGTRSFR